MEEYILTPLISAICDDGVVVTADGHSNQISVAGDSVYNDTELIINDDVLSLDYSTCV